MSCGCGGDTCQDDRDRLWGTISSIRESLALLSGRIEAVIERVRATSGPDPKEEEAAKKTIESWQKAREAEAEVIAKQGPEYLENAWMNDGA